MKKEQAKKRKEKEKLQKEVRMNIWESFGYSIHFPYSLTTHKAFQILWENSKLGCSFILFYRREERTHQKKKEIRFQAYYCTLHEKDLKEMNVPWAATTAAASLALLSPLMLDHR